jgi:hypothetical protein
LAQAEAEASRARFWLSFVRLILGGLVAVSSGAMVGAGLWYFASSTADLPDLGPALVTAGGGDQAPATLVPAPDTAPPELLGGDPSEPRLVAQAPEESQSTPAAPAASSAQHPDPQTLPVLVPDESLHLSWMEEPPIEMSDEIAAEIEPQASEAEDAQEPAAGAMDAQTATDQLLRQPSAGQIDIALANLDLESLAPADVVPQTPPAWRRHAVPAAKPFKGPVIALVIDDLGLNRPNTRRTIELPGPLTLAFMTYAETLQTFADKARSNGHELLVHFPMAPRDPRYDPGPNALRAELGKDELARRLAWGLSRFEGFVGVNNHMGRRRSPTAWACPSPFATSSSTTTRTAPPSAASSGSSSGSPSAAARPSVSAIPTTRPSKSWPFGCPRCRSAALRWCRSAPWCARRRAWRSRPAPATPPAEENHTAAPVNPVTMASWSGSSGDTRPWRRKKAMKARLAS